MSNEKYRSWEAQRRAAGERSLLTDETFKKALQAQELDREVEKYFSSGEAERDANFDPCVDY